MAKATSFENEPWTAFQKDASSIFTDDFVHEKLLSIKATLKGISATTQVKTIITRDGEDLNSSKELKFWFPFGVRNTLYTVVMPDRFKVHVDGGLISKHNLDWNFYGSVQADRKVTEPSFKLGVQAVKGNFTENNRIKYVQSTQNLTYYCKMAYKKPQWNAALLGVFDITEKYIKKLSLQYSKNLSQDDTNQVFFRLEQAGWQTKAKKSVSDMFDIVTWDFVHKYSEDVKLGLEISSTTTNEKLKSKVTGLWEVACPNISSVLKAKLSSDRVLAVSLKNKIKGYGEYIFGMSVHDIGLTNRFRYGAQLSLNL